MSNNRLVLNHKLMNSFYLLDYLKDNQKNKKEKIDLLKYELDQRIYYFGGHFKRSREKEIILSQTGFARFKYFLRNIYAFCLLFKTVKKSSGKIIISDAYFSVNARLAGLGLNILRPLHSLVWGGRPAGNFKILSEFIALDKVIRSGDFRELLSDSFLKQLDLFTDQLTEYYRSLGVDALIVPNDISFFEQLNIQVFKRLGKPSFIFSHGGPPGRYNIYDENQTDYLIVWGEKIKQHYIKSGFKPDKIIVSGHPFYERLSAEPLRYGLDNILVISKSLNGAQHRGGVVLADRGNLIVYLNQVQAALEELGVKKARLRVHPSENINWYFKFIDQDFFSPDQESLVDSLKKSTLVIGPTSTVFLESIYYGVNYLVYEPTVQGTDMSGYPLVPPFDGSDQKVPAANDEASLRQILREKKIVDKTIFNDYIDTPFSLKGLIDRI